MYIEVLLKYTLLVLYYLNRSYGVKVAYNNQHELPQNNSKKYFACLIIFRGTSETYAQTASSQNILY